MMTKRMKRPDGLKKGGGRWVMGCWSGREGMMMRGSGM